MAMNFSMARRLPSAWSWRSISRPALASARTADAARVARHLASVGLPTGLDAIGGRRFVPDRLIDHMRRDKKVSQGRIAFVLTRGIGQAFIAKDVALDQVRGNAGGGNRRMIWDIP